MPAINPQESVGKTVKSIKFLEYNEHMVIIYTDGNYMFVEADHYYDRSSIGIVLKVSDLMLKDADIITQEEYQDRIEK
jgi:hypothetical protein